MPVVAGENPDSSQVTGTKYTVYMTASLVRDEAHNRALLGN